MVLACAGARTLMSRIELEEASQYASEYSRAEALAALFRIKYFRGGWQSEIAASAGDAVSRLEELCAPATRPAPASRFEVEPRHPAGSGEWEQTPRVETPSSHGIRFRQTLG